MQLTGQRIQKRLKKSMLLLQCWSINGTTSIHSWLRCNGKSINSAAEDIRYVARLTPKGRISAM
eukprot:676245-Karenia_brevis.AAC.1